MKYTLTHADCLKHLEICQVPEYGDKWDTIFADPPDGIGLKYSEYNDNSTSDEYRGLLHAWIHLCVNRAKTVWFSFNSRWCSYVGSVVEYLCDRTPGIEAKWCVQTFTFGQHNSHDLGNCHRPLLRLRWKYAPLFPDAVRIESERQKMGDKRANSHGRVPGDVFDFPRVVGNSKQRRKWHPTQLNEGLVERCLRLTTPPGGYVMDPFAGTGTTLRVAERCGFNCDLIEIDGSYCEKIADEHCMSAAKTIPQTWTLTRSRTEPRIEELPLFGGPQDIRAVPPAKATL